MTRRGLLFGLFFPAGLGLALRLGFERDLATQLLLLGTLLLSIEQARAADWDLVQIEQVASEQADERLLRFRRVTQLTIGLELMGFYSAIVWPGWGAMGVLVAQMIFNGLAQIALCPDAVVKIIPWGLKDRLPVLIADGVGVALTVLWSLGKGRLVSASALLGLVLVYLAVKYLSVLGQPVRQ